MNRMPVIVCVALFTAAISAHGYCPKAAEVSIDQDAVIVPDTYFMSHTFQAVLVTQCIAARPRSQADRYEYVVTSLDQKFGTELRVCETPQLGRSQLRIFLPSWGYSIMDETPNHRRCGSYCSTPYWGGGCGSYQPNLEFKVQKVGS